GDEVEYEDGIASIPVDPATDTALSSAAIAGISLASIGCLLLLMFLLGRWYVRRVAAKYQTPSAAATERNIRRKHRWTDAGTDEARQVLRQLREMNVGSDGWISPQSFKTLDLIGTGAFGKIYRGVVFIEDTAVVCAIKCLKESDVTQMAAFEHEIQLQQNLNHPNLVHVLGASIGLECDHETGVRPLYLLMEYCQEKDLHTYLTNNAAHVTIEMKLWYAYELAKAMAYLADVGVIHRDVAARNCLLSAQVAESFGHFNVKLSDMGMARAANNSGQYIKGTHGGLLPVRWMAIESIENDIYTSQSDVWAFAVTVWEIFSNGAVPYGFLPEATQVRQALRHGVKLLACAAGIMPHWEKILKHGGTTGLVATVMPTFTNPNNVAIATMTEPITNGICGNYFFDEEQQKEVMMNDPKFLRVDTLFRHLQQAGVNLGIVTAKDKLLRLLSHGLVDKASKFAVSVEKVTDADSAKTLADAGVNVEQLLAGRTLPTIYDPDISVFTLEIGLEWLKQLRVNGRGEEPTALYLSTTDFVQHKYRPGSEGANDFYAKIDKVIGELDAFGAIIGVTADHGMNDKVRHDNSPNVVFLESELTKHGIEARVILPITDPYVVHHGALGSFGTVYLADKSPEVLSKALSIVRDCRGVANALSREPASKGFGLPSDRIGDFVVVGDMDTVIGKSPEWHDLTALGDIPLRSHGGLEESTVPMMISKPLISDYKKRLGGGRARNFHLFEFLCNGINTSR
ncbi:TK protein kinase, partial [Sphaeroforma arctica JP610]